MDWNDIIYNHDHVWLSIGLITNSILILLMYLNMKKDD